MQLLGGVRLFLYEILRDLACWHRFRYIHRNIVLKKHREKQKTPEKILLKFEAKL